MKSHARNIALTLLLLLIALFGPSVLRADVTGAILGTAHDRSQSVVAGAHVKVTNLQTNLSQETVSAADGSFRFLALPAGTYRLTATAPGFQTFTTTDIDVKVNDQLRIDVALEIGTVTEQVTIEANAVQVQTESTQIGNVIESKQMLALPLNGRSYIDLLSLQAGVAPTTAGTIGGDRPVSGSLNAGNISVNGQRETANAFLVNGGDVSEGRNLGAGLVPNLDSIQEFRLITNSFDAEYGKFSGAVVNVITKSGTNGVHGDAFEFLRNDKLDAKNYFAPAKSELRRNQFGYAVGGPFWKNKLFWFTDYQGTRQVQGAETGLITVPTNAERGGKFDPMAFTTTVTMTINGTPTPVQVPSTVDSSNPGTCPNCGWAELLTTRLAPVTGQTVTINEPYAVIEVPDPSQPAGFHLAPCTNTSQCVFPVGSDGLTLIPQAAWSAPAVHILPYIPAPTLLGNRSNYSNNSQKDSVTDNKAGQRVDFINQKTGNWSWYYHYDDSSVLSALPVLEESGTAEPSGFPSITPSRAQQIVMSNTKQFGPTAVNEARASFFRTAVHKDNPKGSFVKLSSLGFITGPGTLGIIPDGVPGYPEFVPPIAFNGSLGGLNIGVPVLNTFQPDNTYMVSDGFSKVIGKHALKFGGEFRYLQINERNFANVNGGFVFDGSVTGNDFADYVLGAPTASGGYIQAALQLLDSRTRYGGAYIQDSWKATPHLTLNLGLRWEVSMPWYDTQGKIQAIVPGEQSVVFPNSPKGWVFPGDPGIPKTLAPTRYNNFGPRVGLAYSPGFSDGALGKIFGGPGKTSIRASFGIYYTSIEDLNLFFEVADAPYGLYWFSAQPTLFEEPFRTRTNGQPQVQRFPITLPTPGDPANKNLDFSVFEPITSSPGYDIHNKLPYAEHFNFSIQRELSKSTVLTLAYVGTAGHRLITSVPADPGNAALCMQLNTIGALDASSGQTGCGPHNEQDIFQLPNAPSGTNCLSQTFSTGCVYGTRNFILDPNFCPGSAAQPNPTLLCFAGGNTYTRLNANSIYNAGQVTVERKASTDLTLLASYTFSKALDNSSAFGDSVNFANPRISRGLSSTDVTHNFVASYIWAIPFERAFSKAPKRLTQGWQMQGITRFSTGFPIQMSQGSTDISLAGGGGLDMPDRVGNVVTVNPRKVNPACPTFDPTIPGSGTGCFFLPSAFAPNTTLGTFGTANRRFFHGPGFNNTDFGLMKRTAIREKMAFEIRGEFFNIFNHAQFENPSGNITSSNFGVVNTARDPRIGQVSAKFIW